MGAGQEGRTPSKTRHRRPRKRGSAGHSDPEMEASLYLGESESKSEAWELGGMLGDGKDQQKIHGSKLAICTAMQLWRAEQTNTSKQGSRRIIDFVSFRVYSIDKIDSAKSRVAKDSENGRNLRALKLAMATQKSSG